jgi:hypothetical protein
MNGLCYSFGTPRFIPTGDLSGVVRIEPASCAKPLGWDGAISLSAAQNAHRELDTGLRRHGRECPAAGLSLSHSPAHWRVWKRRLCDHSCLSSNDPPRGGRSTLRLDNPLPILFFSPCALRQIDLPGNKEVKSYPPLASSGL